MKDPNQVPAQETGQLPAWKTDLAYDSTTPISTAQDDSTVARIENSYQDSIAEQVKMSNDQQLAFRCKAFNAGQTQNGDPVVPSFQAGELKDEDVPTKDKGY